MASNDPLKAYHVLTHSPGFSGLIFLIHSLLSVIPLSQENRTAAPSPETDFSLPSAQNVSTTSPSPVSERVSSSSPFT